MSLRRRLPVDEDIVEVEVHDEVHQRLLDARRGRRILALVVCLAAEEANGVGCLSVGHCVCDARCGELRGQQAVLGVGVG